MKTTLAAAAIALALGSAAPASAAVLGFSLSGNHDFTDAYWTLGTTFTLPTGFTSPVLTISNFDADDRALLFLNGTVVANTGIYGPGNGSFVYTPGGSNDPFTFTSGNNLPHPSVTAGFVAGLNTLSIVVNDTYVGIYGNLTTGGVGPTSASFDGQLNYSVAAGVPEPSTWAMMLMGLAGLGYVVNRKRRLSAV